MMIKSKETNEIIKFVSENFKKYTRREIVITMTNRYKVSEERIYKIIAETGLYETQKRKKRKKRKVNYYEIDPRGAVERLEKRELERYLKKQNLPGAKILIDDSNLWRRA